MAARLTIDQGNTATKAAVWSDDKIVAETVCHNLSAAEIDRLAESSGNFFEASIFSTVRDADPEIVNAIRRVSKRFIELTDSTPLPIKIEYNTPRTLGHDRIAAAAGAYALHPGKWLLVVDCGTAITYDVVSPDGVFIGGNIAPGIFMRLEALNKFTSRLPLVQPEGSCPLWGRDTETALRSGAVNGVIGELLHYKSKLPQDSEIILTGGYADIIADRTDTKITVDRQLVAKGLISIINYNENI